MLEVSRSNRIKDLFSEALYLDEASRTSLLWRASAEDASIAVEVRSLLDAHARAREFLGEPEGSSPGGIGELPSIGEAIGDLIDRYRLDAVIGEGGFGRVYRASQSEPVSRTVALKVIKAGMDTRQVIARFQAERQALALMDHPGIARVYDAGATAAGRPYFVMEMVDGPTLTDYADAHRLGIDQRLHLFRQVCAAVQHAHAKGVVHRDLKPSNVLVTQVDGQPQPKVIDFGIAKAIGAQLGNGTLTEQPQPIGTPEYMSPEQAEPGAADIDTRSDVYALGVLLYQLLTGATPFDGERLRQAGFAHMQCIIRDEEPPRPSERLRDSTLAQEAADRRQTDKHRLIGSIRGELDWITLKALEKDRERRYGSPAEMAEDVRRRMEHEPVLAGPPGAGYRLRKFVRRHRVGVLASSVVALGLVAGAIVATVGMLKARAAAERERLSGQEVEAVNGFMRMVLTSASPESLGAAVRLADVLDVARDQAGERFSGHPAVEAQVREILASAYLRLSLWSQASEQYALAADLWRDSLGDDNMRAFDSTVGHAQSLVNMARGREAQTVLDDLLLRMEGALDPRDERWIVARALQANVLKVRSRLDESEQLYRSVLRDAAAQGVSESLQVDVLDGLVDTLRFKMNRRDRSTPAAELEEYRRCASELLERGRRMGGAQGERHTFRAMQDLANVALHRRDFQEAAAQCRALLDQSRERLGECHISRICAMQTLADALRLQGQTAEPADLYLRVIACERARTGSDSVMLLTYLSDAQIYLERDERWAQAEACCRETIDTLAALGAHTGTFLFEARLAHFVSHQPGRHDEAQAMFASLMARRATADSTEGGWLNLYYADHLTRAGEFEQAERLLLEIGPSKNLNPDELRAHPPDDLVHQFIILYEAWGKPEKAAEIQRSELRPSREQPS